MNLHTHHSGNISGRIPSQSGNSLLGPPAQSGMVFQSQPQNSINCRPPNIDPEIVKVRKFVQTKIYEILVKRNHQSPEISTKKMIDIVKRLEEGLFRSASSREEYQNMATLGNRLHALIKHPPISNENNQFQHANSSPSMGTMIPTPGLSQSGNSFQMHNSVDCSLIASNSSNTIGSNNVSTGGFFPAGSGTSRSVHGGSFNSSDDILVSGYQQPSTYSVSSGGAVTSMGMQRITSQMIPTPGYNQSSNGDMDTNPNNQSVMKFETSDNIAVHASVDSSIVSHPMHQKLHVGGQNSLILQSIGGHIGSGIRSTLHQRSYGLSSGVMNGGMGLMGNNISLINGPGISKGYVAGTMYDNTKPLQGHIDQPRNLPTMQGDGYGIGAADSSVSGNLYAPVTVGSANNESLNSLSLQSTPKTSLPLNANQQNTHFPQQVKTMKQQSIDQSEEINYLSQYTVKENLVQPHQHQQFQQVSNHFQYQQVVQQQPQQKNQNQNQLLLKKDMNGQSYQSSKIVSEEKFEPEREGLDEVLLSQVSDSFQFSDMHHHFQQNTMDGHSRATLLSHSSDQMQHPQHFVANSQTDVGGLSGGKANSDSTFYTGWNAKSPNGSQLSGGLLRNQNVQEDCSQRVTDQDVAERNNVCSKESLGGQSDISRSAEPPNAICRSSYVDRERQFKNQQRWLLFLRHARKCAAPEGKCQESHCIMVQKLIAHADSCNVFQCPFPRCYATRVLIDHNRHCRDSNCPVCVPVRNFIQAQLKALSSDINSGVHFSVNGSYKAYDISDISGKSILMTGSVIGKIPEDIQPPHKRMKIEQAPQSPIALVSDACEPPLQHAHLIEKRDDSHILAKSEMFEQKIEIQGRVQQSNHKTMEMKNDYVDDAYIKRPDEDSILSSDLAGCGAQDVLKTEKEIDRSNLENMSIPCENASKSGKPKINGVSLTELFTPEQVRQHIRGLRQWVGQSKAKAEKNQAMGHSMGENSCQLCAVEKLNFEPPPIYCTPCGARIKRNAMYYTSGAGDTRRCFCIPCYNEARGDAIVVDGISIPKAQMEKKKNDEETEEWWVQCDKCEAWQHQICALFNGRRNEGGQADYTCPNCYIGEVERGERTPLSQNAVLGAKDLPRTILSDHIEQRLFTRLKHERQNRAMLQGKTYDEVPGAEALVVRVVSSVDKKLEVKPRFSEIFREQNYPTEFPYKSKVILLFQNIEGVEVCLFGMYVQEFGSESQQPNHRRVYLSYLDSVKYFRPDVRALTGEALRTFVYHEILIGYLDYCKKRGFTSCYIWACPPLKGEDYILYCHPEIQKTPKSDKLREWYLAMLKKAEKENIVVGLTNLYDHFFTSIGESKAKITAARLPYFDGDYWPGAAEDIIYQLQQEDDPRKLHKKGIIKKSITKRALKASGQTDLSGNASKDLLLMHKLGETISPMKEDFIMVHLQHACTHCCMLMVSGNRWVCKQCKKFQLCDKCYDAEQEREDRERHPVNHKEKHTLYSVQISGIPDDTLDKDEILESEFFDTRQAFLCLCQGNHYQYDTLRRAKHSSMMVLYHLHNPTAPAFVITCYVCHIDIEAGQSWRCETCPDYDVCNACYQKGIDHPHKLTNNPSIDRDAQNTEARELRVLQLRKMLDLLVHASECGTQQCQYLNCRKVKGVFVHGGKCKVRASGGCLLCKKMWNLLQLHARACKESKCLVPRCRDLKEHMRRLQQQSDSRRRAAVMEMMRQRAAEVAGSS